VDLPEKLGQTEHKNLKGVVSTHPFFDRPVTQVLFADTSMNTTSSWMGPVGVWSGNHVDDPDVPQGNSAYHDGHVEWHSGLEEVEDFHNGGGGLIKF
jgi:prepilin-type processing-associated H-X9-DG protein